MTIRWSHTIVIIFIVEQFTGYTKGAAHSIQRMNPSQKGAQNLKGFEKNASFHNHSSFSFMTHSSTATSRASSILTTDPNQPDAPVAENIRPIVPRLTTQINRRFLLRFAANTLWSRDTAGAAVSALRNNKNAQFTLDKTVAHATSDNPKTIVCESRRHWISDAIVTFGNARKTASMRRSVQAGVIIEPMLPSFQTPLQQQKTATMVALSHRRNSSTDTLLDLSKRAPRASGLGRYLWGGTRKFLIKVCFFAA